VRWIADKVVGPVPRSGDEESLEEPHPFVPSRSAWIVAAVVSLIGVFHIVTTRSGHVWGDDFAMYIQHAKNVALGRPFGATGYVYCPLAAQLGPRTYPPLCPLLLAPVYRYFGLHLFAMKLEGIFFFVAGLWAVYAILARRLPFAHVPAIICVFGLNPFLWHMKDVIGSESLFFFLCMLAVVLVDAAERETQAHWRAAVVLGLNIYLCYATRTVGIVLVPALLIYTAVNGGKRSRFAALAAAACLIFGCTAVPVLPRDWLISRPVSCENGNYWCDLLQFTGVLLGAS